VSDTRVTDLQQPQEAPARIFDLAVSHQRAGRIDQAEQLYRAVLEVQPDHFGALHYLGLVSTQQGRLDVAEALLRRAVTVDPGSAEVLANLGIVLTRLRRFDDAIGVYHGALALDPCHVEAHNNLGATLQSLGRFEEAVTEFAAALRLRPGNAGLHNNLGIAFGSLGRAQQAVAEYERAVAIDPRNTDAQENLGNALVRLGRYDEALARFYRALDLAPEAATTRNALGAALLAVKGYEEAIVQCRRAIAGKPDLAEAHNNLGMAVAALKRHDEAVAHYRRALEIKPDFAEVHNNLGNAFAALKRRDEAIVQYRRALELKPGFFEVHNNLGNALSAQRRHADAIPHFRRALEISPDFAEALGNLAIALTALNRHDEALACYERSLAIAPDLADVRAGYGNQLMILGRLDQARRELERAIAMAPARAQFHRNLAAMRRFSSGDPELAAMQALAANMSGLDDDERMDLHFALGKAHADIGLHDSAFEHLMSGNALKRRQTGYDEAATLGQFERIAAAFTPQLMRRLAQCGDPSTQPIFIVGMPRSGTTLVEQVLASHPRVFGAGEIGALEAAVAGSDGASWFPQAIASMTGEQVRRIGVDYRDRVTALAPAAQRITDKLLTNFRFVGLIHLALPNARIIHVQRHPVDGCLSCFFRLFDGDLPFAYDLAELGRYYRAYARLMAHWRSVLPDGAMLELQYEDLVTDFSAQARRLVTHCGLEWDERCSAFYETRRPVTTSSATQVRQPIYRSSIDWWPPYRHRLAPLLDALGVEP
jgi:tetratricopeptide (TPR) repeat protein